MSIREEYVRTYRTARYALVGDPSSAEELWVALHGYGQLAERFARRFESFAGVSTGKRAVVVPEALSRFYVERSPGPHGAESLVGATWMTRADRENEIRDYVEYLDVVLGRVRSGDREDAGSGPDVLLGFSQGAETASRWAVFGDRPPATLILWGGGLAEDLDPRHLGEVLAGTRVVFVVGSQDRWARKRSATGLDLLRSRGLAPELIEYAGGHRVDPEILAANWP